MPDISLQAIGTVRTAYRQKFAIPRQPNLVTAGSAVIELFDEYGDINSLRGLEQFSHLWLIFLFHATAGQGWSPTVQPPRLGGRERAGVFASRSPFRPNPIGISAVQYLGHDRHKGKTLIKVRGADLLDGTPVLDLKPYIPYADAIAHATGGYADGPPAPGPAVAFSPSAGRQLAAHKADYPELEELITQVLGQDPRPAWRTGGEDDQCFGMKLYELNIRWRLDGNTATVTAIEAA